MAENFASNQWIPPDAQDILRCIYCDTEIATYYCRTCTDDLCPSCKNFHVRSNVPFGHEIINITEKHEEEEKIKKCIIHEKNVYFACCVECKLPVCTECMKNKHNGHHIGDISKIFKEENEKARSTLSQMKERIQSDGLDISSAREGMLQIEKWFEDKREEYKKEGELLKEEVERLVNENIEKSREDERRQKKIFEETEKQNTSALKDLISKYEEQLSKSHPAELLVFLKGHVPNPEKIDIYPRFQATSVQNVYTIKLEHHPKKTGAESIIKIKSSPLNEIDWIEIMYLDAHQRSFQLNEDSLVAASITIGTSHSKAALLFLHAYKRNPLDILYFHSISNNVLHNKTDILYAGKDAAMEYEKLKEGEILNCSILKEMNITPSLLKQSIMEAEDGSTMEFSTFYTTIIDLWRNKILNSLEERETSVVENDIQWVISLPPPWDSKAERLLLDYLVQKRFKNYCILSSETAILRYCEFASSRLNILNGKNPVEFSEGDRILFVQSEVKFADITSAVVLENSSISPIKKKRDMRLGIKNLGECCITEIGELLGMNRDDLGNLVDEDSLLETLRYKCKLSESSLQSSRQWIKFEPAITDEILEKMNLSKFVSDTGPIFLVRPSCLRTTCSMLPSLLQDLSLRLSHEIKTFMSENTSAYIIMLGEFASWPIVLDNLRHEFPETCTLVSSDLQLSIISGGSVIHGLTKRT